MVCVVLASEGYPGSYEKGKVILGIEEAEDLDGVVVFHAGTVRNVAYEACDLINFEGKQYRHDIGRKAAEYLGCAE